MRRHLNRMDYGTSIHLLGTWPRVGNQAWRWNRRPVNLLRVLHGRQRSTGHNIGLHSPLPILDVLLRDIFVILLMLSSHCYRWHICSICLILWISSLCHGWRIIHVLDLTKSWWLSAVHLLTASRGGEVLGIIIDWNCSGCLFRFATEEEEDSKGC